MWHFIHPDASYNVNRPANLTMYRRQYSDSPWKTPLPRPGIPGFVWAGFSSKYGSQVVVPLKTEQNIPKMGPDSFFVHTMTPSTVTDADVNNRSPR